MNKVKDLTGLVFGKLKALSQNGKTKQGSILWLCTCECGNTVSIRAAALVRKSTISCGCARKDAGRRKIIDLIGQKFGRLTVLSLSDRKVCGRISWICSCECGNKKSIIANNLVRGIAKSCGCLNLEKIHEKGKNCKQDSGAGNLFDQYRSNAQARDLIFSVTFEEFKQVTSSNCHYCGCLPFKIIKSKIAKISYTYNGIDRKDNSIGYEINNCLPCCSICNHAKHVLSYEDFQFWLDMNYKFVEILRGFP